MNQSSDSDSPTDSSTRLCRNCRYWESDESCHANPPTAGGWPKVGPTDWCGRFNPRLGAGPSKQKVSDEAIITIVADGSAPKFDADGKEVPRVAIARAQLVRFVMDMGLSQTPALKRIDKLVRQGVLRQGPNPWPQSYSTPGIHIWVDQTHEAPPERAGLTTDTDFLKAVRRVAPSAAAARSLRAIHREIEQDVPMSLATAGRRMNALMEAGLVQHGEQGYYAVPAPAETLEIG